MKKNLLYLLLLLSFTSCHEEPLSVSVENLSGSWLGGAVAIDQDIYRPMSQVLHFSQDSVMEYLSFDGDTTFTYHIRQDTVDFPFRSYPKSEVRLVDENLLIGKFYPQYFRRIPPIDVNIDTLEVREILNLKSWESDRDFLEFNPDSLLVYDFDKKEKERVCWEVLAFKGNLFLARKGSFAGCDKAYHQLELITAINSNEFEVIKWVNDQFRVVRYVLTTRQAPNYDYAEFQVCNPHIYRNMGSDRYYFKYTSYRGGLYMLRKLYEKKYRKVEDGRNTGIVRIGFIVNCLGDIGDFDILEMDENYKEKKLNREITDQLLEILKSSGKWIPGERNDESVDTYKYVSFRIKDGRITEIFP